MQITPFSLNWAHRMLCHSAIGSLIKNRIVSRCLAGNLFVEAPRLEGRVFFQDSHLECEQLRPRRRALTNFVGDSDKEVLLGLVSLSEVDYMFDTNAFALRKESSRS